MFDRTREKRAARWFSAQRRGLSAEEAQRLQSWSADRQNRAALADMHDLWNEVSGLKSMTRERPRLPAHTDTQRNRWSLALAAGLLLAVSGVAGWWQLHSRNPPVFMAQTSIGEQRSATLPDGSRVDLNVVTRLDYTLAGGQRAVRLSEGEALFFVRRDAAHPFIVRAGDYEIRALGTAFDVRERDGRVQVETLEGVVSVRAVARSQSAPPLAQLTPGEKILLGAEAAEKVERVPLRTVAQWREHVVSYEDVPIAEIVADLNRYFQRPLRVPDPTLADSRVTLSLQLQDRQQTLRTLSALLGVNVRSDGEADALVRAD